MEGGETLRQLHSTLIEIEIHNMILHDHKSIRHLKLKFMQN